MLLPHGYEGQGPEHSSARLERFLTLCAEENIRVCNVTTPAQYFHLLRSHIKLAERKPLIIMTPKSLLRHPEAKSGKEEFIHGRFKEIIDDNLERKEEAGKLIFTSGKIYYDLNKFKKDKNITGTAIIRIEQFYPYKGDQIKSISAGYPKAKKIIWVQEEPKNMGAWNFLQSKLSEDIPDKKILYAGRPESASPAVGSAKISAQQQKEIVEEALRV
jgi:2-oxoglutarate dehydrogenase E1 component